MLLFVYNADEGLFAALGDAVHKAVSPDTYPCSLCAVSYGAVRMRPEWRAHLRSLPYATRFFHRQDFRRAYPELDVELPAILLDQGSGPRVLVDAGTLNGVGDVKELIDTLSRSLRA
ncbi:hypothetical protein CKY28_14890 [Sphingomonas lenta]|uniref:GTPase n=2 Tax=Sphingomonas lenta TaxID=1141887 RepID=A0A2A2SDL1_9SPHN|nr:hypothetical protein CKY28_14890 [Sphingomonas lenta]